MSRDTIYDLMPEIKERWSPRAYASQRIEDSDVRALLEAASLAPSCFNEQPWRFLIADRQPVLDKMRSVLSENNHRWAGKAPVIILVAAKKNFSQNGKQNRWHMFDTGTAWGFLTLEAQRRGLITHAMAGFNRDLARELFTISDEYEIVTVVAIGKYGYKEQLPADLQEREEPNERMSIEELLL